MVGQAGDLTNGDLGEILRQALEAEPESLVGASARPGYRTMVDGRFDLDAVARRFVAARDAAERA